MKFLNKVMYVLVIIAASVTFGIGIIGLVRANAPVMFFGILSSAALSIIAKHWDDVAR